MTLWSLACFFFRLEVVPLWNAYTPSWYSKMSESGTLHKVRAHLIGNRFPYPFNKEFVESNCNCLSSSSLFIISSKLLVWILFSEWILKRPRTPEWTFWTVYLFWSYLGVILAKTLSQISICTYCTSLISMIHMLWERTSIRKSNTYKYVHFSFLSTCAYIWSASLYGRKTLFNLHIDIL